jgi:hypothetical protein
VALQGVRVAAAFVAEQLAAPGQIPVGAGAVLDQHVLVVVAYLVPEVAQHGSIRLAEPDPHRFPVHVERLDEIDGDDPVGVADYHALALAVTGHQVEGQAAVVKPERINRQTDVEQLVHQPTQGRGRRHQLLECDRVRCVGFAADQRVGQAPAALVCVLLLGDKPVAA